MNKKDIVIGIVIVVVLAFVIYWLRRPSTPQITVLPSPTPSVEEKLESSFKVDIPQDVEKVELRDVVNRGGAAIATKKFENNTFTMAVLADLPDPASGAFYNVWITQAEVSSANATFVSLGRMRVSKGGWMLEYKSNRDFSPYKGVIITEEKTADTKPETRVMEGTF